MGEGHLAPTSRAARHARIRALIQEGEHPSDVTTGSPAWIKLARMTKELCTGVQNNEYLVVLKTPPGAAQYYGSAIDKAGLDIILGTIAGDDTIALMCATTWGLNERKLTCRICWTTWSGEGLLPIPPTVRHWRPTSPKDPSPSMWVSTQLPRAFTLVTSFS